MNNFHNYIKIQFLIRPLVFQNMNYIFELKCKNRITYHYIGLKKEATGCIFTHIYVLLYK